MLKLNYHCRSDCPIIVRLGVEALVIVERKNGLYEAENNIHISVSIFCIEFSLVHFQIHMDCGTSLLSQIQNK